MKRLIYLHGFRSSPQSAKAQRIVEYWRQHQPNTLVVVPELSPSPSVAIAQVQEALSGLQAADYGLIGSSLGAYYATWLAETLGCRCACINPAIHPQRDLRLHVGQHQRYGSAAAYRFTTEDLQDLAHFKLGGISHPERYYLLAATGDEIIDWHDMVQHYADARMRIILGGDHGLANIDAYLPSLQAFFTPSSLKI